jgi:hypothetical protein
MTFPFNIQFVIFDENKELSKNQKELRKTLLWDNLRGIIKELFNNDVNIKWLDRVEASVSSNDEKNN